MTFHISAVTSFASAPWISGDGTTREVASGGDPYDPTWRLLLGSTSTGGTWERLPATHEGLVLGVRGPRTEIESDGATHRLSSTRAALVSPRAGIRVHRTGSPMRSEILLLSFATASVSGSLRREDWDGDVRLEVADAVVLVLDGVVRFGGQEASRGMVARLRGEPLSADASHATVVIAALSPLRG